ncbi:MAG: DNA methyltransferase [Sulfurimonas sp.]|nr:DNA methyltransferase [Sulfurimonas sp.]
MLCDEVFGEENFVAQLPTVMNLKGNNDEFGFAGTHEYTFVFAKQKEKCELFEFSIGDDELEDWLEDENGFYKQGANLKATGGNAPREKRPNLYFPLFVDSKDNVYVTENDLEPTDFVGELTTLYPITNNVEMSWRWGKDKFRNEPNNIIVSRNGTIGIYKKQRPALGDMPSKKPKTIFYKPEYSSGNGTTQVKDLFGEKVFSNPKPLELLNDLIEIGLQDKEIVLDFFAGSGTTAHAVMELNKDAKNRKFITVQLPELIDSKKNKIAYDFAKNILDKNQPTIFDITKERITRASKKTKEEISKDVTKDISDYDLGFKIFETTPLLENPLDKMDKFDENQAKLFDVTTLREDDFNALLTTWKVHDGMKLTDELQDITFKEYKGYYGDKKLYFVHNGFTTEDLKEFIKKLDDDRTFEPNKLILFGYTFDSRYQREISEALASYTNKKSIEIDMIVRY